MYPAQPTRRTRGRRAELSVEAGLPVEGAREGGRAADEYEPSRPVPPLRLRLLRLLAHRASRAGVAASSPSSAPRAPGGPSCLTGPTRTKVSSTSSVSWRATPSLLTP